MTWRFAVVIAVIALAWLAVHIWERRVSQAAPSFASGLTLITGANCSLCPQAVAATNGAGIRVSIVDIDDLDDSSIRSLPTAIVADTAGAVIAQRSGRSAISGMPALIALAREVA